MVAMSPESGAELLTDTRQRTSAFGRQGDDVKSQFAVLLFMRETDEEAHAFYQQVVSSLDTEAINEYKNAAFGPEGSHSARAMYDDMEEQEVLEHWGIGQGLFRLIGSPKTVAEELIAMYGIGLLDGFAVSFPVWHEWEIRNFAEKVLPILKSAGVWLPPWEREWCW
jgi:alkanesulfonate monooxygenase SsuD/methylene tetrahydromethanopterin reductase-like flavin-dependent oxidoreductase (luciferase family)